MKIFISASKSFYERVTPIMAELERLGHEVTPPNGYDMPQDEANRKLLSPEEYAAWKAETIREDGRLVQAHDAVVVLNFEKNGIENYVGGAAFLEMFKAFDLGKKLYLYNPIPEHMLQDEIIGLQPIVLYGDLTKII